MPVTYADVQAAAERIAPYVHRTPVLRSRSLDALSGARLYFKCENLQRTGAFKARGAFNAVLSLSEADREAGVVTHSSGNHGAALALAASTLGLPAWVAVPDGAPRPKRDAVGRYGARVTCCGPTLAEREASLAALQRATAAHFVPPYDHAAVIAGQGTAALELIDEVPELDAIWVPIGGGGLASGCALVGAARGVPVFAVEPALADDAKEALERGQLVPPRPPQTIADGLRTALGAMPFQLLRELAVPVTTVTEAQIVAATWLLLERLKLVVEPSGAVPLAGLLARDRRSSDGSPPRFGVILTGGNVDLTTLPAP